MEKKWAVIAVDNDDGYKYNTPITTHRAVSKQSTFVANDYWSDENE